MSTISSSRSIVVEQSQLMSARFGQRFGRLDLQSQLAVLAVASLNVDLEKYSRDRVAVCLATSAGSLTTDLNFWKSRKEVGGPSPTLFAYTLPSAAVGEIAIHFKLTGPNLCFVGGEDQLLTEGSSLIERGEADACICVYCEAISADVSKMIAANPAARATATFLHAANQQKA